MRKTRFDRNAAFFPAQNEAAVMAPWAEKITALEEKDRAYMPRVIDKACFFKLYAGLQRRLNGYRFSVNMSLVSQEQADGFRISRPREFFTAC